MILTSNLMDNFFEDAFGINKIHYTHNTSDIKHSEDGSTIKLKVPGFNKKSIDISVDSDFLTIEGKTDDDAFTKKYAIDNKYDSNLIDAKVVDGLFTLFVPFKAEVKPKKIKVN